MNSDNQNAERGKAIHSKIIEEIMAGEDPWQYATFEGAVQLRLKIDIRTSLAEKLEWLEEADRLARQLNRHRPHLFKLSPWPSPREEPPSDSLAVMGGEPG